MQLLLANGSLATPTAAMPKVATGTALKTMQQVKPLAPMKIFEWGCSYDASAAATPGQVELIETGTVFATVTAQVAGDATQLDAEALLFNSNTTYLSFGTAATGFTASAEGSITAVRFLGGPQQEAPTGQIIEQFPLGYRPFCQANDATRIRVIFGTTVNIETYLMVEF